MIDMSGMVDMMYTKGRRTGHDIERSGSPSRYFDSAKDRETRGLTWRSAPSETATRRELPGS